MNDSTNPAVAEPARTATFTTTLTAPASRFTARQRSSRIREELELRITEHTYLPKTELPRSDWVVVAAVPAYESVAKRIEASGSRIERFCAIGTGAGVDAIAALELLGPHTIAVTDLHAEVVAVAQSNIERNAREPRALRVHAGVGPLAHPLRELGLTFDLIYENLPNLPLDEGTSLYAGRNSSSFCDTRALSRPADVHRNLFELHYDMLVQARDLLSETGRMLCVFGGRVPLREIVAMPALAGYDAELLVYSWKIQSEADEVVPAYLAAERAGRGPFHFYPIEALARAFDGASAEDAVRRAADIEAELRAHALSSARAWELVQSGEPIGHTVTVLEAIPRR